ncbi:MAG: 3-phosphoshikimate 1-carboxyvinyltransferase [Propionibacteriaceae bacterium]|nr:3-phosphoshikimate 1-carboxyvinyltransferase [Propionibacteriaceae bacterium]
MSGTPLPASPSPVVGEVSVPGSKSETNRALVFAALADGPSTLREVLDSRDSTLMIDALRALGVSIERAGTQAIVTPLVRFWGARDVDCGLAGTVMRFVPPVTLLGHGPTSFIGDPHASERPMKPLIDGLRQLGAIVSADALPFRVVPPAVFGSIVAIDASESSQFVSGFLNVAPRLPEGLTVRHTGGALPSRPHIEMTVRMLRARGVQVDEPDEHTWVVAPGPIRALDVTIEPDLTNASVFLAAAAATGGRVTVPGWAPDSLQPGRLFLDIAQQMGATVESDDGAVTLQGPAQLTGVDVDLSAASELTPCVAALGALAEGETTIRGVAHIRGHETDRIAALVAELRKLGVAAEETPDGLRLTGGAGLRPAVVETYADHRMVHFAAIVGLRNPGTSVTDLQCVSKTMPAFPQQWAGLVA